MVNFTILAGGYTNFVATYVFNSATNVLSLAGQSTTGARCSWISLHPTNRDILYAVNENSPGAVQSFVVNDSGFLSDAIDTVPSGGGSPAFVTALSTGQVGVMNYGSGTGKIIPTTPDHLHFLPSPNITFDAPVSHPHMVLQHGDEVLVPDLGADRIWRLVQDAEDASCGWKVQGLIVQTTGSGPRHIALKDGYLYTLHELSSTLTSQLLPPAPNASSPLVANLSIIPSDAPAGSTFAAAEILIPVQSDSFPGAYVFVSNRNRGVQDPKGDAITVFKRGAAGELNLERYVYTGLSQIRGMQFFSNDDRYLIAGGEAGSEAVAVFERTGDGGNLTLLTRNTEVPARTTFVWLSQFS